MAPDANMPGGVVPVAPARVLDTRVRNGVPTTTAVPSKGTVTFTVAGRGNIPATGASGVFLNVTVTAPTGRGYVAAYPAGGSSTSSNLNFAPGQSIPNLVFVPLGTGTNAGKVTLRNGSPGTIHLVADTAGYVRLGTATISGATVPVAPVRVLDTRVRSGVPTTTAVPSKGTVTFTVAGRGNIPATGASGVFLNVTVTAPTGRGYVAAYPAGGSSTSSNLNFAPGQSIPNLVFVPLGTGTNAGKVTLRNGSPGTIHLVADTAGYVVTSDAGPSITAVDDQEALVGLPYRLPIDAKGGTAPYAYSADGLPDGLSIVDGVIMGQARNTSEGSPVTITVTDAKGIWTTELFKLTVVEGLPAACADADGCADVNAQPRTRQVPASAIGEITLDEGGNPTAVLMTGAPPIVDDVLVLAPTETIPTGVVVIVTAVESQPDGTSIANVIPGNFADAYNTGTIRAVGETIEETSAVPSESAEDRSPSSRKSFTQPRSTKSAAEEGRAATTQAVAQDSLSCEGGMTSDLHGMSIVPSLKPQQPRSGSTRCLAAEASIRAWGESSSPSSISTDRLP